MSEVLPYIESDTDLFPSHRLEELPAVRTNDGDEEYYIE